MEGWKEGRMVGWEGRKEGSKEGRKEWKEWKEWKEGRMDGRKAE